MMAGTEPGVGFAGGGLLLYVLRFHVGIEGFALFDAIDLSGSIIALSLPSG